MLSYVSNLGFSSTSVLIALVVGFVVWLLVKSITSNLPPGPYGLPIVGYVPFLGKHPWIAFHKLAKTYGDVICINMAGTKMVSLNSYEAIRDGFVNKGEQFSGRIIDKKSFFWWIADGLGIAQDEGVTWREHRRFTLHTLRDFGFGKLSLESRVHEIGGDIISGLESMQGKPFYPKELLANSSFNVILYLTTDQHFKSDDPDFLLIRNSIQRLIGRIQGLSLFFQSILGMFLPMEWLPNYSEMAKVKNSMHGLMHKYIKQHKETFDEDNLRDFMDVFLQEQRCAAKEGREATSTFSEARLTGIVLGLLFAGTETISNTLSWAILILAKRQDIQKKIQQELDEVVGKERLPSILDKANLPYTEAFILEIQRYSTVAPLGLPHSNPEAASLYGYNIPARSIVMANIYAVHNDPKIFPKPEVFDPERFLDPEHKTQRRERVVAFSIGKRSCLGEAVARMEVFLFLTMIVQRFSLRLADGEKGNIDELDSFFRILLPFNIVPEKRV